MVGIDAASEPGGFGYDNASRNIVAHCTGGEDDVVQEAGPAVGVCVRQIGVVDREKIVLRDGVIFQTEAIQGVARKEILIGLKLVGAHGVHVAEDYDVVPG